MRRLSGAIGWVLASTMIVYMLAISALGVFAR